MANTGASGRGPRAVRERLIVAGAELLVEQPAGSITGRELARRAGVNYGLIHHYFGSKSEVLDLALRRLRDQFLERSLAGDDEPFSLQTSEPYFEALAHIRDDYRPEEGGRLDPAILGAARAMVRDRLDTEDPDAHLHATARTLAAASMRLGWSMLHEIMLDALDVAPDMRQDLVAEITRLYDSLLLRESQSADRPT